MDRRLARDLLARRRLYVWSVASGLVGALFVVAATLDPSTLTPTTRGAVRATADAYYPDLPWSRAAGLVVFLFQGPYLLGLFGSIVGVTFAAVLLHGWQWGTVTAATDFDHDASTGTVEAVLALVTVHGAVLTASAYLPAFAYFAVESRLVNPLGAWVALGPAMVVGCTLVGGLAVALAGVLDGPVARGAVALFAFVPPLAGIEYAHAAPTSHPSVGFLAVTVGLAVFVGVGREVVRRRTP